MGAVLHGGMCSKLSLVHHGHSHGGGGGGHGHSHGSRGGHNHSHHGHSHGESRNMNVRAALIHVIGDLVQSIGVLIAAIVIKFEPSFRLADPICTFLFSGLVLATTVGLIRDGVTILMEGVPRSIEYSSLRRDLKSIDGVRSVHSLHAWSLTLDKNAIAVHLAIGRTFFSCTIFNRYNSMDFPRCDGGLRESAKQRHKAVAVQVRSRSLHRSSRALQRLDHGDLSAVPRSGRLKTAHSHYIKICIHPYCKNKTKSTFRHFG